MRIQWNTLHAAMKKGLPFWPEIKLYPHQSFMVFWNFFVSIVPSCEKPLPIGMIGYVANKALGLWQQEVYNIFHFRL